MSPAPSHKEISHFLISISKATQSHKYLLAALLIAGLAAYPLLSEPGLLNTRGGGDSPFLLQRLHQLETAVLDGHFPVRWMPDANYGYGYPFYNFYAPLSIYITAVFRLIGFSFVRAIQLSQLAGFLVATWGMFQLGNRWWGSEAAGFITAVAYTLAPFHLVTIYTRGDSLAEFWAMALYPLVILTADKLLSGSDYKGRPTPSLALPLTGGGNQTPSPLRERVGVRVKTNPGIVANGNSRKKSGEWPNLHYALLFSLAYAALILSHNISALIFTPFLGLFILLRWLHNHQSSITNYQLSISQSPNRSPLPPPRPLAPLLPLLLSLPLALALAAWFFLPALVEQPLAQLQPVTEGYFHYSNHFRSNDLTQTSFLFSYNPDGGQAFRMGFSQTLTAVITLLLTITLPLLHWFRHRQSPEAKRPNPPLLFPLLTALIATFMITPASRFLWDNLPLLPFTQFPWRFLSVQAFGLALLMGVLARLPWRRFIVTTTAVFLLITSLGNLHTDHLILNDSDITAERLAQYEWFTGNIGTTISAEYLPPTVQPRPVTSPWLNSGQRWPVTALNGELQTAVLTQQRTTRQTWQIETTTATDLIFPTLHWPGWQATIDGQPVPIQSAPSSGLIQLTVPPGPHTVQLRLSRTPIRLIAELISLLALMIVIWLARPDRFDKPARFYVYVFISFLLIALIVRIWPERKLPNDNLTWDFAQMGYLQHGSVPFNNGNVLKNYDYSTETAVPHTPFTLTLNWQGSPAPATINLHTPAIHRHKTAPALATLSQTLQPGLNQFQFSLPANSPAGLVVPQLLIANGNGNSHGNGNGNSHPLLPNSQGTRGNLFLRPFRINNPGGTAEHPRLDVQPLSVQQQDQIISVQLTWFTPQPLSQNYNVSLRLVDSSGTQLTQFDTQPGYGHLPSSSWPPGQWLNDWLTLPLPDEVTVANTALVLRLYDVASSQVALTRRLGDFDAQANFQANQPSFVLPQGIEPATAVFGDIIQLHGYQIDEQTPDSLSLSLYWQALSDGQSDYTRFVHLIDANGTLRSQNDGTPRHNSYPTSQWTADEIISDSLSLPLTDVPPGTYQLIVGFYEPIDGLPRLTAVDQNKNPLPGNTLPLLTIDN